MSSNTPNIILINCDDLGYGDLGCYGSEHNDTPHLDRLAAEGTRFTDFYMASPVCSPSRGGMLTGCYPPRIGFDQFDTGWVLFPGSRMGMSDQEETFGSLLKKQGYATQLVGKWHCGDQPTFLPTKHGFDHYYGLPYSNDMGRQVGRTQFPPLPLVRDDEVIEEQPDQASLTQRYVEEGVRFMRAHQDGPFLLYFAHMYVHLPLIVPERFAKASRNGSYGAAVAAIDWATGVLMAELDRLGIAEDTLILFTSDNGSRARDEGGSNAPCSGTKGTTWEGGMRLPLIARWPGTVPAGRVCQELIASIDLLPTFAALADTTPSGKQVIDGVDQSDLLIGASADGKRDLFFYYFRDHLDAVRDERFKLVVARKGEALETPELFDLRADIGETTNVASKHPDAVERLQQALDAMRQDLGDATTNTPGTGRRPCGEVEEGVKLTTFDRDHPYFAAEYDIGDAG